MTLLPIKESSSKTVTVITLYYISFFVVLEANGLFTQSIKKLYNVVPSIWGWQTSQVPILAVKYTHKKKQTRVLTNKQNNTSFLPAITTKWLTSLARVFFLTYSVSTCWHRNTLFKEWQPSLAGCKHDCTNKNLFIFFPYKTPLTTLC